MLWKLPLKVLKTLVSGHETSLRSNFLSETVHVCATAHLRPLVKCHEHTLFLLALISLKNQIRSHRLTVSLYICKCWQQTFLKKISGKILACEIFVDTLLEFSEWLPGRCYGDARILWVVARWFTPFNVFQLKRCKLCNDV